MSLDVLAQHLASKGRNGDSMLVHMTPGEVHGLHALALAHGGKLTINPDTGLPEANFLKKLLPMIAGFALGPAGFGIMSSLGAAATVGGVTALATGSLTKGLMAGLGAYGGSGLGAGLMGAGEGAIGASALASEAGKEAVASKIMEQGLAEEAARSAVAKEAVAGSGFLDKLVAGGKEVFAPGGLKALSAGMPVGSLSPKALGLMAAAPIVADQGVQTVTPMSNTKSYVRPFVYDAATFGQGPQGLQALAPIDASTISYGPPPGGANGGLVAFADGGLTPEQKAMDAYNASRFQGGGVDPAGSLYSADRQAAIAADRAGQLALGATLDPTGTSITGWGATLGYIPGGYQQGQTDADLRAALPDARRQELVNNYLSAVQTRNAFGWKGESLNTLLQQYMSAMIDKVDPAQATVALTKGHRAGVNLQQVAQTLDPEFDSKVYRNYYDPNTRVVQGNIAANVNLNDAFTPGSGGWSVVKGWAAANNMTPEQVADALGVDVDAARQSMGGTFAGQQKTATSAPPPAPEPPPATQTPALDYITGRTPDTGTVAPPAPTPDPRFDTPYPEPTPAPAPAPVIKTPEATVTPGTVTGGGVTTPTTPTTPTFELPREEQIFKVPTGTITGGTVTGTVDTKEALREYERTAPTGKPPEITSAGTLLGYKGEDKTYGGVEKPYAFPTQAQLGTAGSISRGTETMDDVRRLTGNRYDQAPSTFTPSISGASKSAYDFLMGKGAYPTDQFSVPDVGPAKPLWRPYVQAATGATAPSVYIPATGAPAAQFGFKPITGTTPTSGTQRWKNSKTGEIYLAPAGYAPPSNDWVLDTQGFGNPNPNPDTEAAGVGGGKAGGLMKLAMGGYAQGGYNLGSYSDGGRLLRGPGDGVSDSIPATIGHGQPARLADGEFVVPARIVSELGNGSTEAGARKLYAMMDRVQRARSKTVGKNKVAANTKADRFLPA